MNRAFSRAKLIRVATAYAVLSAAIFAGCGKTNPPAEPPANPPPPAGQPQPQTPAGPVCIPISGQIPFTATNIYFDSANLRGGTSPYNGQTVGQVVLGGAPQGGPYQSNPQGVDGIISMNITPAGQSGAAPGTPGVPNNTYPGGQSANATGFIQISAARQQAIINMVQTNEIPIGAAPQPYGQGQPNTQPQPQICVSGLAFNMGHRKATISGDVFLYLNNSNHGAIIYMHDGGMNP
jgi:hypothetical protein